MRIKEYYDVMIAKKWFWSCLWSVNLRLGTSYLVHRTKNFLLKPKWAPNFEIFKNLGKFDLKCGTIDILCHNFCEKLNFIGSGTDEKSRSKHCKFWENVESILYRGVWNGHLSDTQLWVFWYLFYKNFDGQRVLWRNCT